MSDQHSRAASAVALGACVVTAAAFDTLYTASLGELGSIGYPLLVTALSLLVAAAVVALAGRRSPGPVLAGWVALVSIARFSTEPLVGLALGALCAGGVLWATRRAAETASPASLGVCVGSALFLGFVVAPEVMEGRVLSEADPELRAFASIGVFLAAAIALGALLRSRRGARAWAPLAGLGVSGALVVAAHGAAIARAPDRHFASPPTASGPNIVLLILDTVRADHLSLYGYARETTPRLAERLPLETGAVVYPQAYSTSNWTRPAHASLFTGRLPSEHDCHERTCGFHDEDSVGTLRIELDDSLAKRLAEAGYRTGGVMGNHHLTTLEGLGEGFDVWKQARASRSLHGIGEFLRRTVLPRVYAEQRVPLATAASVNRDVLDLMDDCALGGCFIAANYIDTHYPYFASRPYAGAFGAARAPTSLSLGDSSRMAERVAAAYDEEILELDAHLGALLDEIDRRGLLDDLWLFITSDHGESFGEHGSVGHGTNVYDDQVRIPLIVRPPRGVTLPPPLSPVGLLDVTATISAIATGSPMGHGRDLRRADETSLVQVEFFGWEGQVAKDGPFAPFPARAVVQGRHKLIEIDGRYEFYELAGDPDELRDRAAGKPELVERLAPLLPPLERHATKVKPASAEVDRATVEALRALGYID